MSAVPQYHEVPHEKLPWWANTFLYVLAMSACMLSLIHAVAAKQHVLAILYAVAFLLLFVWTVLLGVSVSMTSGVEYQRALSGHDRSSLILAASSPEYTDKSRDEIIKYLNLHHKGWSFSKS